MIEIKLPSLGADMDQGTLLEWRVKPGDAVKKGDILAVIDTTKAALDVECWQSGEILDLLLKPGQTVAVGTPMLRLLEPGEGAAAARAAAPLPAETPVAPISAAPAAAPPTAAAAAEPKGTAAPAAPSARRPVSPAARRRSAELGVSLESVVGSGPNGVVTLKDVEDAAAHRLGTEARSSEAARDRSAEIRRTIAAAMSRSKREVPHYYLSDEVPLGAASDWLRRANQERPITDRLLMAALYVRALARAAQRHPDMNGVYVENAYRPSASVHVGMAISLRGGGLIAPAIHSAEQKSLEQIMRSLTDLVARARAGKLRRDEFADPTITLTNLGDQSVTAVYGVIYAPQVALVGFGQVRERAWVIEGRVVPMPAVTLTLSADHRVSDGHAGARFLAAIGAELQHPEKL
ncbi:MAG TPA: dihydrolipoamide acetyltransferase family protein [Steroidobacteraceae bacterium]|nr:dihydrolipoamide acetyltransferase family protein [Steroidobacteraceae bacterium]